MNKNPLLGKKDIIDALKQHHQNFNAMIEGLPDKAFTYSWKEKWTPGQQYAHIRKSIVPVALALWIPRFVLRLQFGVTNRPSRSYDGLVARYLNALQNNKAVAPKAFRPPEIPFKKRNREIKRYQSAVNRLVRLAQKCSDKDLDYYVVPHPLIGKLTLREILFFCVYHVQHHQNITQEILDNQLLD